MLKPFVERVHIRALRSAGVNHSLHFVRRPHLSCQMVILDVNCTDLVTGSRGAWFQNDGPLDLLVGKRNFKRKKLQF